LHISWCRKRKRAGETESCEPSRFIAELPQDDLRLSGMPGADPATAKETGRAAMASIRAMLGK
jgi:ATP-dependent DNA helicase Rep